jgi:single-stranded-DNA-specific exonuclease
MESYYFGNGRRWVLPESITETALSETDLPGIFIKLLSQRNISSLQEAQAFLNPSLEHLHDPFLLDGMEIAANRIVQAIENKEKILIYGDYDVDGVSATAIMVRYFQSLNLPVDYYIPDRVDEGYGISEAGIEYIGSMNYDLMITVDCGITARFQVEAIYERYSQRGRSIDIIITDHHQSNAQFMPEALVVIDPHVPGCNYPFKNLCGAGLALKLVHAVGHKLGHPDRFMDYLDLAALATIADIVELKGENRIITKYGIEKIIKNPCLGMKALLKASAASQMDSYRVSFALAPRVNAAGRMGDAKCAVALFTTQDEAEAEKIAELLNQSNIRRQEVQDQIFKSAVEAIDRDERYQREKILVVYGEGWHHGVIGIVASKLVDRYHKPAFVLSIEEDKAVGSARSVEGFNLFNAMEAHADLLVKFGGHEQAGGLTLQAQDIEYFRTRINEYAERMLEEELLKPALQVQLLAGKGDISLATAKLLTRLEPFGSGNTMPLFCYRGATLVSKKTVGNGKHLKLTLDFDGERADGVYFNKGYLDEGIFEGDRVDVVFTQEINLWQNQEYLQLKIWDMHLNETVLAQNRFLLKAARQVECLDCDENSLYNGIIDKIITIDDITVNRDILAVIYRNIARIEDKAFTPADLFVQARILAKETKKPINGFKFFVALLVFDELELISLELQRNGTYRMSRPEVVSKVNLEESEILEWVRQAAQGFIEDGGMND